MTAAEIPASRQVPAGKRPTAPTPAAPAAPGRVEAFTAARAQAICPACGGFAEHFDGCHLAQVHCTCDTRLGCHRHGPQPRDRAVLCRSCLHTTWAYDAICTLCHDRGVR